MPPDFKKSFFDSIVEIKFHSFVFELLLFQHLSPGWTLSTMDTLKGSDRQQFWAVQTTNAENMDIWDGLTVVSVTFQHLVQSPQRLECDQSCARGYWQRAKISLKGKLAWRKGKVRLGHFTVETGRQVAGISRAVKWVHVLRTINAMTSLYQRPASGGPNDLHSIVTSFL